MRFISLFPLLSFFLIASSGKSQSSTDSCLNAYTFRIVVIGSSTAAGAGASPLDSAWVNRYRYSLQQLNPANQVINLALGGYNTYRLMPDGFTPPSNRPAPDTLRNITKALSLQPDAIIVNLPSNDAAAGFSLEEQLANFDTIVHRARQAQVPIWVCTTQPRNFSTDKVLIQLQARDSILARYGNQTINFWDSLATPEGLLSSIYNAGDGIHVNNAGHQLLFTRVQTVNLPAQLAPLPQLTVWGDTVCAPAPATLRAMASNADTILWFTQPQGGNPAGAGAVWTTPVLNADSTQTFYAEARRGPFTYHRQLTTTTTTNRDWNGVMFDLAADTVLVLDSLSVKMRSTGDQTVVVYTRTGGLSGWENTPGGWQLLDSFPVRATNGGDFVVLPLGAITLHPADTMAFYLHLADPAANLAYLAPDDTLEIKTAELTLRNSTGVAYAFTQRFYPRLFSGRVFYHFGDRPEGSCRSERLPVPVAVSRPKVDLGPDSLTLAGDSLLLDAGAGFVRYEWSGGSSEQRLTLRVAQLQPGANAIWVLVTDSLGCTASDTVTVYLLSVQTADRKNDPNFQIAPNPGQSTFLLFADPPVREVDVSIFDQTGQQVYRWTGNLPARISGDFGPAGMYWVNVKGATFSRTIKWIKSD